MSPFYRFAPKVSPDLGRRATAETRWSRPRYWRIRCEPLDVRCFLPHCCWPFRAVPRRTPKTGPRSSTFPPIQTRNSELTLQEKRANERLNKETDGRIQLRFYYGGIAGDDKTALRKMRAGTDRRLSARRRRGVAGRAPVHGLDDAADVYQLEAGRRRARVAGAGVQRRSLQERLQGPGLVRSGPSSPLQQEAGQELRRPAHHAPLAVPGERAAARVLQDGQRQGRAARPERGLRRPDDQHDRRGVDLTRAWRAADVGHQDEVRIVDAGRGDSGRVPAAPAALGWV